MKGVDVIIGAAVLFMGVLQYLLSIESVKSSISFIGEPGSTVFNVILIALGLILIVYGLRKPMPMMIRR